MSLTIPANLVLNPRSNKSLTQSVPKSSARFVCSDDKSSSSTPQSMKAFSAAVALSSILLSAPMPAVADISGLTPCKDSKQFAKREKQQIKKLESSLKLYAPPSLPISFDRSLLSLVFHETMATQFSASVSLQTSCLATTRISFQKPALISNHGKTNLSFNLRRSIPSRRLSVSCAAKQETIEKVSAIVKKQLSLTPDKKVVAETKFADLGADSLDTVEIVMGLEEEFNIQMAEEKAQKIATVEQAAELIEELINEKK